MTQYMQSAEQDEDEFHNSFRLYLSSLKMLAEMGEVQCELMGNYNVAWELKDEVCAGRFLVGRGYLTAEQEAWVQALCHALGALDTQVLPAGASNESNLAAMSHPGWEPMRYLAKEVISQLAPLEPINAKYLGLTKQGSSTS